MSTAILASHVPLVTRFKEQSPANHRVPLLINTNQRSQSRIVWQEGLNMFPVVSILHESSPLARSGNAHRNMHDSQEFSGSLSVQCSPEHLVRTTEVYSLQELPIEWHSQLRFGEDRIISAKYPQGHVRNLLRTERSVKNQFSVTDPPSPTESYFVVEKVSFLIATNRDSYCLIQSGNTLHSTHTYILTHTHIHHTYLPHTHSHTNFRDFFTYLYELVICT